MSEVRFLIDINLPYFFSLWNTKEYLHQVDLGLKWPDEDIWDYAATNNLTIITKDSDFYSRILISSPPPKVIHIRFGNLKMRDFYLSIQAVWPEVLKLNQEYKLVKVYTDRLEAIN
jgi:predicted nuclease of predicted toxin-antitoxin system